MRLIIELNEESDAKIIRMLDKGNIKKLSKKIAKRITSEIDKSNEVINSVLDHTGYTIGQIRCSSRKDEIVLARQVLAYLIKHVTNMEDKSIGQFINRDRATVKHSCKRIKGYIDADDRCLDMYYPLIEMFK